MRLQDNPSSCGPAALCNALEPIGIRIPSETAHKLTGCTGTKGTSERGIIRAIRSLGHRANVIKESDAGVALVALRGYLFHGVPVILVVDSGSHWVSAVGVLGSRVCVVDSADGGVTSCLETDALVGRWEWVGEKRPFYGIAVIGRAG